MPTCFDVADFFLASQDVNAEDTISNMKLQKLCYYAQGFTLAITDEPLFEDDIQAWPHGPVIPALYNKYKSYNGKSIPIPERSFPEARKNFTKKQLYVLDEVYRVFAQYSAWRLRDMTHQDSPWIDAWNSDKKKIAVIPKESMRSYFKTMVVS